MKDSCPFLENRYPMMISDVHLCPKIDFSAFMQIATAGYEEWLSSTHTGMRYELICSQSPFISEFLGLLFGDRFGVIPRMEETNWKVTNAQRLDGYFLSLISNKQIPDKNKAVKL